MRRLGLLLLAAALGAGCRNAAPMQNPFFGPTTVPPPGTGNQVGVPPVAPYYQGGTTTAPPAGAPLPGNFPPPPGAGASTTPSGASSRTKVVQAGGRDERHGTALARSRWNAPEATTVARPITEETTPDESSTASTRTSLEAAHQPAGDGGPVASVPEWAVVRVVESDTRSSGSVSVAEVAASEREPERFEPADDAEEIGTMPAGKRTAAQTASYSTSGGESRSRSVYATARRSASETSRSTNDSLYGYDPGYRWLKGKLEYSEIDRRWKLRYIPIDGATDEFGGSVVLPAGADLGDFQAGDYVTLEGAIGEREEGSNDYAPVYRAERIGATER